MMGIEIAANASTEIADRITRLRAAASENETDPLPLYELGAALTELGVHTDARIAYEGALRRDPQHLGALWALYELETIMRNDASALTYQMRALAISPVLTLQPLAAPDFERMLPAREPLSVMMLCAPGDFQVNTPLEYIADARTTVLHKMFLGCGPMPDDIPPYDIVFNAIAYASDMGTRLEDARRFAEASGKPVLNRAQNVEMTSRESIAAAFAQSRSVYVPALTIRSRAQLATLEITKPMVVRPRDSQAGKNLVRLESSPERNNFLEQVPECDAFFCTPFVDYRSSDGYYRKYRIAFVDGVAYPVHLAISPKWMVHYYNAPMAEHAWMRAEEESFMADVRSVFSDRRADALVEIAQVLPLEYFAIDCTIGPDGRVLLFEADTAMIVHMCDSPIVYPYKRRYVARIVEALDALFERTVTT